MAFMAPTSSPNRSARSSPSMAYSHVGMQRLARGPDEEHKPPPGCRLSRDRQRAFRRPLTRLPSERKDAWLGAAATLRFRLSQNGVATHRPAADVETISNRTVRWSGGAIPQWHTGLRRQS